MAILGKIQQKSGVLIGIIALALFAFIIQGLIKNSSSIGRGSRNIIAEVGDRKIETNDFQKKVALLQNQNKNISNMQAMKSVWDQVIKEAVLNNQFDKLGINIGEERIRELFVNNPSLKQAFTNEQGVFDENALLDYVTKMSNPKNINPEIYAQWKNFENSIIEGEKEKIYMNLIKAAGQPTLKEGEWQYHFENDAVDFKYAAVPYTTIPDSTVQVTNSEIESYIQKHANDFKVEASRDLQYVFIPIKPSADDKKMIVEELKKLIFDHKELQDGKEVVVKGLKNTDNVEEFIRANSDYKQPARYMFKDQLLKGYSDDLIKLNKGDIYGPYEFKDQVYLSKVLDTKMVPDSAKAAHILIAYKGALRANPAITRSKEAAKKTADSLLKIVKRNPSKFADYAKKMSDGPTKTKGGDLGWFRYGQMVPKFNDFVFEGKKDKIGLVETDFGFHIIKINDLTQPEKAIKLGNIVRNVTASNKTENQIFADASKFASLAMQNDSLKKLAKDKGYEVKSALKLGRFEDNIPGLGKNRDIVRWAYNKDRKVGDIQKFDMENGHVVAKVTAIKNKGLMSAEEAANRVRPILIKEKKAKIIREKMVGNTLDEITKNAKARKGLATGVTLKNPVVPGFGKEPQVVAKAFVLEIEKLSDPIDGNRAVYVIQPIKKKIAADIKNYLPYVETLKREQQAGIEKKVIEALKEKENIEDKRDLIYQ